MEFISEADFEQVARKNPSYFKRSELSNRWLYYKVVIEMMREMRFDNALEIGSFWLPLIRGSETLDIIPDIAPTYLHDATQTPWPVRKRFDLAVGLQCFEHFGTSQVAAFGEVRRLADQAILSFPYRWNSPGNPSHHDITREKIATWTHGIRPAETRVITIMGLIAEGVHVPFDRIIYRFDFRRRPVLC